MDDNNRARQPRMVAVKRVVAGNGHKLGYGLGPGAIGQDGEIGRRRRRFFRPCTSNKGLRSGSQKPQQTK